MKSTADVVIIGGGIMGCSIAYHLTRKGIRNVVLLEKEAMLGTGATGRCSGGFRHQFSTEINIRLSQESVRMMQAFPEEVGEEITFHQDGYLFLLTEAGAWESFRRSAELQRRLGVPVELLGSEEILRLNPNLSLEGVLGATYCSKDGISDPLGILHGYAKRAREAGVEICMEAEVVEIERQGGTVSGVRTRAGRIAALVVINAAGPQAGLVGDMAGVEVPVRPTRRHVFVTHGFPGSPPDHLMVIDFPSTFYFHKEGDGVLMGMSDPSEPYSFVQSVDWTFLERLVPVAVHRYPVLAQAKVARSWAGLYEMSPDAHPILGEAPELPGFFIAAGFSGHGFQQGPVVGKLISELVADGRTSTMDISSLSLHRFRENRLVQEQQVV